jgi:apolipoprotein N-acyltransferase
VKLAAAAHYIVLSWGWRRRAIAFAAGAVSALSMAPFDLWPVLAITFPVLVWLIDGAGGGRAAFAAGWWFGFGYFLAGLYWIGMALLVEADRFAWFLPLAVIGIPAGLALFTGFGTLIARQLWSAGHARILAFAAGLTIAEWMRGFVLTGFPWNSFGQALAAVPALAQAASLVGLWGLTLIALVTLASPAVLADPPEAARRPWLLPALSAVLLVALAGFGLYRLGTNEVANVAGVRLRIMQPNLAQDEKFRPAAKNRVLDLYSSISDRATAPDRSGLRDVTHLIWPESAFPFFLEREPDALARLADLLPPGVVLITGAARAEQGSAGLPEPRVYNSIRVIGDDGAILSTYDKLHLVPFGEFLPFQNFLEQMGLEQLTRVRGGFTPGARRRTLTIPRLPPASPLICYEAIFPGAVLPDGNQPEWLLNLTNDAWFGNTPGPYQHFSQARLRTIEEGLPLVRAANNGISAVIDPLGRILHFRALGVDGVIDSGLPQSIPPTVYARLRDVPTFFAVILLAFIAFFAKRNLLRRKYSPNEIREAALVRSPIDQ